MSWYFFYEIQNKNLNKIVYGWIRKYIEKKKDVNIIANIKDLICDFTNFIPSGFNSKALRRICKELKDFEAVPPDNITVGPINDDMFKWRGTMMGPPNTPYEGGVFFLEIKFPYDYPWKPPKIKFTTKIFHCHVNHNGYIKSDLEWKWRPFASDIKQAMKHIYWIVQNPIYSFDPLVPNIAKIYNEDRKKHDKIASEWTRKYAQ